MIGESVKIVSGPFDTFTGEVYSLDNSKNKMIVQVSIFGRKTPVEINYEFVEKVH
jgi:transcriptional antiterminator NusG